MKDKLFVDSWETSRTYKREVILGGLEPMMLQNNGIFKGWHFDFAGLTR